MTNLKIKKACKQLNKSLQAYKRTYVTAKLWRKIKQRILKKNRQILKKILSESTGIK